MTMCLVPVDTSRLNLSDICILLAIKNLNVSLKAEYNMYYYEYTLYCFTYLFS